MIWAWVLFFSIFSASEDSSSMKTTQTLLKLLKRIFIGVQLFWASQVAQWVKNLPAMKETQAKVSLIQEHISFLNLPGIFLYL